MTIKILIRKTFLPHALEFALPFQVACGEVSFRYFYIGISTHPEIIISDTSHIMNLWSGRVAQSVGHLTRKSGVLGLIPGLATYFGFSFCFFKKGSCQLLAKVCARSTG